MDRTLSTFSLVLLLGATLGCSPAAREPYAAAYRAALPEYHGTEQVTAEMTDRFVRFFSHGHDQAGSGGGAALDPSDVYAERLYFSDTLLTTENREVLLDYLERLRDGGSATRVEVLDTQVDGEDVYVVWQMQATFTPLFRSVTSLTIGVSHLRFDEAGRIVLQQDFWDSAEGFYRHLPVLGFAIDQVKGGFDDDTR